MPIISSGGGTSVTATTFTNVSGGQANAVTVSGVCVIGSSMRGSTSGDSTLYFDNGWEVENLKQSIANLVIDGASVGHFEAADLTPISLGTGGANPLITRYVKVTLSGGDIYISSISGDGTASGAVTFEDYDGDPITTPEGTYPVIGIYGLEIDGTALSTVKHGSIFEKEYDLTETGDDVKGKSIRLVLPASSLSGGTGIRLTLKGTGTINAASIAERQNQETCDDWTFYNAVPTDAFCPRKTLNRDDDSYAVYCYAHNETASILYQNVDELTPTDSYTLSFDGSSYEGDDASVFLGTQDGEDYKWYNFTGDDAGTFTTAENPGATQTYSVTLAEELSACSIDGIIIPSTGSVDIYIGTLSGTITLDNVEFTLGEGENTLSNGSFEDWTVTAGTASMLDNPEPLYFLGEEEVELSDEVVTDWLPMTIKADTDYIVALDLDGSDTANIEFVTAGDEGVYISNSGGESAGQGTALASTLTENTMAFITKVEVGNFKVPATYSSAVYDSSVAYESATEIYGVNLSGSNNGMGIIYSFDDGNNWKAYTSGYSWVTLVSNQNSVHGGVDGVWHYANTYTDGEVTWAQVPLNSNTLQTAITLCITALLESTILQDDAFSAPVFSDEGGFGDDGIKVAIAGISEEDDWSYVSKLVCSSQFSLTQILTPSQVGGAEVDTGYYVVTFDSGTGVKDWLVFHNLDPISELIIYTI